MGRVRAPNYDASEFIEKVRKDAVPTYHTASDANIVQNDSESADKPEIGSLTVEQKDYPVTASTMPLANSIEPESDMKYRSMSMEDSEIAYVKRFIASVNFTKVNRKGRTVNIRAEYLKKIKDILGLLDEDANVSTFVDNVLTEHFERFHSTIVGISKKCPPKF